MKNASFKLDKTVIISIKMNNINTIEMWNNKNSSK